MSIIVWESSEIKERKFGEDDVTGDQEGWRVINMILCVVIYICDCVFYSQKLSRTCRVISHRLCMRTEAIAAKSMNLLGLPMAVTSSRVRLIAPRECGTLQQVRLSMSGVDCLSRLSSRYLSILTYRVHEYGVLVSAEQCMHVFTEHSHYVQGVAWDPLGQYLATQSSDR